MLDPRAIQRRTLRLLFVTQIISGVGVATGSTVGALLAADLASVAVSGLAGSAVIVGAALFALPATAIVRRRGRRPSLAAGYFVAALGAMLVVVAALRGSIPLLFAGFFLFGGATTANLQARYAAVDLAPPPLRGRHLSFIVWATTLGAVAGPQFAAVSGTALAAYGVPTLAAPFFFSALLLATAGLALLIFLRPDPAIVAGTGGGQGPAAATGGVGRALEVVLARAPATLGVSAMAIGQMVMSGVMAMTPVHIKSAGHDAAHTLRIVGVVLSFHIAGMYAFAPLMGWLTDRLGRRPVIFAGVVLLLGACALAGTAGHNATQLSAGLMVLGLGWSASTVAGATLVSESVPPELRASAQGLSDLIMGLAGATAGALSGAIVGLWSYATLTLVAAVASVLTIVWVALFGELMRRRDDAAAGAEGRRQ
jgi:MFS family permease